MVYLLGLNTDQFQPFGKTWANGIANKLNLQTLPRHADQILLAAGTYQGIFSVVSPILSRYLMGGWYNEWDANTQLRWDQRVVSTVQAVFVCAKALSVIFTDPSRRTATAQQRLWAYSAPAGDVQAWAAGYFLWDTYLSVRYYDLLGPTSLMHGICAFIVTMLGFRPFANYYGVNFVLYELSTPFLNIHWALDKFGKTGSNVQLYNGIALMASFAGCRLVWGSYQTWLLSRDMLAAWREGPVPQILFSTYLLANTGLTCLNFYWFSKMIQALQKRFQPKKIED